MRVVQGIRQVIEWFVGALAALMFLTFIVQITVRYSARLEWVSDTLPILEPSRYGWTLEFCLLLWVWIIFIGCAFVVRDTDHVTFDILYNRATPKVRRGFIIVGGSMIAIGLALSLEPTWNKFYILRLKKTATLSGLFGDWIRMRDIYAVYAVFLIVVSVRYAGSVWSALRGDPLDPHRLGKVGE